MATLDKEVWQNVSKGYVSIFKLDNRGNRIDELIPPGGKTHLLPDERIMNHEICLDDKFDVFQNGILHPVRIVDSSDDYVSVSGNPNHVGESELKELLKLHAATLRKRLKDMTALPAVQRLLELAEADEDTKQSTLTVISERLAELDQSPHHVRSSEAEESRAIPLRG